VVYEQRWWEDGLGQRYGAGALLESHAQQLQFPSLAFMQGGIFDPDPQNSDFATANRVYLTYCSSDLWSGDVAASPATFGYSFRGRRIVRATISALAADFGLGATLRQRMLFGGCSAGAIGSMSNLDLVAEQLKSLTFPVEVKGLFDAAALVDVYPTAWPWSPDLLPLQTLMSWLVAVIEPVFPADCVALHNGSDAWKCMWSSYRLPLVQTPYFTNAVQSDDFFLQYNLDNLAPSTSAQFAYVQSVQDAYLDLFQQLPPGTGLYSPTCLVHCLMAQATYYQFQVNGQTPGQALSAWYFDQTPTSVVSSCQGWACTTQCGVTTWGASIPCNMGPATCEALVLPTYLNTTPAPASSDAELILPGDEVGPDSSAVAPPPPPPSPPVPPPPQLRIGSVALTEPVLNPGQIQSLRTVINEAAQQSSNKALTARSQVALNATLAAAATATFAVLGAPPPSPPLPSPPPQPPSPPPLVSTDALGDLLIADAPEAAPFINVMPPAPGPLAASVGSTVNEQVVSLSQAQQAALGAILDDDKSSLLAGIQTQQR